MVQQRFYPLRPHLNLTHNQKDNILTRLCVVFRQVSIPRQPVICAERGSKLKSGFTYLSCGKKALRIPPKQDQILDLVQVVLSKRHIVTAMGKYFPLPSNREAKLIRHGTDKHQSDTKHIAITPVFLPFSSFLSPYMCAASVPETRGVQICVKALRPAIEVREGITSTNALAYSPLMYDDFCLEWRRRSANFLFLLLSFRSQTQCCTHHRPTVLK